MAGELMGTLVIIADATGNIVGQGESTLSFNGTPVDISNKSTGDNLVMMNAVVSGQQMQIAMNITYNSDTQYKKVRADSLTGTQDTYTATYGATGEIFSALMVPTGMSDALPMGDRVTTSLTLMSSGVVTHTPQS